MSAQISKRERRRIIAAALQPAREAMLARQNEAERKFNEARDEYYRAMREASSEYVKAAEALEAKLIEDGVI